MERNKMNQIDTPRTNAAINASGGQWSFALLDCSSELERELTAVTEQRDRLAEALINCMPFISGEGCGEYSDAKLALQSLNQPTEP
jgi:hypothetical protein